MRDDGFVGLPRSQKHRTTIPGGKDAQHAAELLDRDFTATAPNHRLRAGRCTRLKILPCSPQLSRRHCGGATITATASKKI